MRPYSYVVYFNQEKASSATHEAIDREEVDLRKPVTYLEKGKWAEHKMDKVCPLIEEWKTKKFDLCKYVSI